MTLAAVPQDAQDDQALEQARAALETSRTAERQATQTLAGREGRLSGQNSRAEQLARDLAAGRRGSRGRGKARPIWPNASPG